MKYHGYVGRLTAAIRVADEVWIATALLHREHPDAADFTLREIAARVAHEDLAGEMRRGVMPHISVHAVANRPPDTGRYRILFETTRSRRRLFRPGDPTHPGREGGKMAPERDDIPPAYHALLDWYEQTWLKSRDADPLLALATRHRGLWRSVDPDDYVRRLREGWK